MPEAIELRVGGREWRGMPVAETDDGDARHEVELLVVGVVPDAAAVAADDRQIGPRVRR